MPRRTTPAIENDPLILATASWLACGVVLLGLTPLPLHTQALGWAPAFWLLAAPGVLLIARRMLVPRQSLVPMRREIRGNGHANAQAVRRRRTRGALRGRPAQRSTA